MIVSITEHYLNETSINWFCDAEKASEPFQELVRKALASEDKDAELPSSLGFQSQADQSARVHPPCMVDDEIELWNN